MPLKWLNTLLSPTALMTDLRSAIVGSIFGALVGTPIGLWWAAAMASDAKQVDIIPNVAGYAQPFPLLLDLLSKGERAITVSFKPETLRSTFVCEFSRLSGPTDSEMIFAFLDRYPAPSEFDANLKRSS